MSGPSDTPTVSNRRQLLKQLAVIPAAAAVAGCERTAQSSPTTPAKTAGGKGRQFVDPPELWSNAAYSTVVRVGQMVFVTAQLPMDEHGNLLATKDIAAHVRQCWKNIEIAMRSVGGSLKDVVRCDTFVTNVDYIRFVAKVRSEIFPVNPPTTSRPIVVNAVSAATEATMSIAAIGMITD